MDTANALQEIEARLTARAFTAVHHPEQGPAIRRVLAELLEVLDRFMSADNEVDRSLCIIKCYRQLVSRQESASSLWAPPFRRLASPPTAARRGQRAIP
ncbi:hypothetical protein FQK07_03205 [Synechococcus sp. BSF8S]|nr:hypothetical protein [Synechococcus sp. BSF8S]MBC1264341.1 hypothetical protein [Synechococcus sp. BSA11S]